MRSPRLAAMGVAMLSGLTPSFRAPTTMQTISVPAGGTRVAGRGGEWVEAAWNLAAPTQLLLRRVRPSRLQLCLVAPALDTRAAPTLMALKHQAGGFRAPDPWGPWASGET